MNKTIGILGGMGPEATSYFFDLIIRNTRAARDQEHIPVLIYSNPRVPPRTDAMENRAPDPTPFLVEGIQALIRAGADFMVMPCITAHFFLPQALSQVKIPVVNLLDQSAAWGRENIPGLKTAGLISSSGTIKSGLFHRAFEGAGMDILTPEPGEQEGVMEAIFGPEGIKAGNTTGPPRQTVLETARTLISRGAEAVIAGCTEIPLVLRDEDLPVPLIEPMKIAALECIRQAGHSIRQNPGNPGQPASNMDHPNTQKGETDSVGQPCDRLGRLSRLARLATLNSQKTGPSHKE